MPNVTLMEAEGEGERPKKVEGHRTEEATLSASASYAVRCLVSVSGEGSKDHLSDVTRKPV